MISPELAPKRLDREQIFRFGIMVSESFCRRGWFPFTYGKATKVIMNYFNFETLTDCLRRRPVKVNATLPSRLRVPYN